MARKLGRFLAEDFFVAAEVSVQLTDSSIVQPDLVVGHKSAVMSSTEGFLTIPAAQILLIVEVAATSLSFDRGRKAALYAREGITEYWVIDAGKRLAWMHRRPSAEGFREVTSVAAEEELRPAALELRDFAIRVRDLN